MNVDDLLAILKMLLDPRGFFFYIMLALVLFAIFLLYRRSGRLDKDSINYGAYRLRNSVLTKNELAFYQVLEETIASQTLILSKVRLADIFSTAGGRRNQGALNRINSRHVDFVVCDENTFRPVFAIELDDRSHSRPDRVRRDAFVNQLFESAGLPLVRIPARGRYDAREVKERLAGVLSEN